MAPTPSPILSNISEPRRSEQQPGGSLLNPSLLAWITVPVLAYLLIGLFLSHRVYPTPWRNIPKNIHSFATNTQYPLWLRQAVRDAAPFTSEQQRMNGGILLVACKGVMIKMAWHLVGATVWPLILFWEAGKKLVRGIKRRVNHQVGSGKDGSRGGRVMSDDDDDDDDETPNTPPSDENNLTRIVIRKRPPQTKKEEEGGQGGTSRSTTANTTGTQSRRRRRRRRRTRHETGAALQRSSSEQEITRLKEKFSSRENPLGIVIPDLVGGATSSSLGTVRYYCPRACPRPPYLDFEENGRNLSGVKCRCASVRKAWSLDDMRSMRSMSERVVRDTNGDIHGGGGGGRATQHPSESNHSSPGFALNGAFGDGKRPLAPPLLPLQRRRSFEGQVNGVYPEGRPMAPERRGSKNNGNGDTLSGKPKIMKKQSRKGSKHDLRGLSLGTIYEEEDELEEHRGVGVSVNEREESRSTPKTRTRGRGRDSSQTSTSDSEAYKCREQCQCAAAINIS